MDGGSKPKTVKTTAEAAASDLDAATEAAIVALGAIARPLADVARNMVGALAQAPGRSAGRKARGQERRRNPERRRVEMAEKKSSGGSRGRSPGGGKYGPKASEKVEKAMHEMKRGQLRSGRSGKKVRSRKQAIAIGLSQARRHGAKVPRKGSSSRSGKK